MSPLFNLPDLQALRGRNLNRRLLFGTRMMRPFAYGFVWTFPPGSRILWPWSARRNAPRRQGSPALLA